MRLASMINGFTDELQKIAKAKNAGVLDYALVGGGLGALMPGKRTGRNIAVGAGLGALVGVPASIGHWAMKPDREQQMMAQVPSWEPEGYVPSWQRFAR